MEETIIMYVNLIAPVLISVLSSVTAIVSCIKQCKKIASTHDVNLKSENDTLRRENKQLRAINNSNAQTLANLTQRVEEIENRKSKIYGK